MSASAVADSVFTLILRERKTTQAKNSCFICEKNSGCLFLHTHHKIYEHSESGVSPRRIQSRDFAPHKWTLKSLTHDTSLLIVRSSTDRSGPNSYFSRQASFKWNLNMKVSWSQNSRKWINDDKKWIKVNKKQKIKIKWSKYGQKNDKFKKNQQKIEGHFTFNKSSDCPKCSMSDQVDCRCQEKVMKKC